MKNLFEFKEILILGGVLSMILSPTLITTSHQSYAAGIDCTNWEGRPDKDCDGIADVWEDDIGPKQYNKTVNGVQEAVVLPSAVNWKHKDILVEIDSMSPHTPTSTAIDLVKTKFSTFGLNNPDGTTGVKIHYIRDDTIPHRDCINVFSDTDGDATNDFDNIKKHWMGTNGERGGSLNSDFYLAKRDVYHYVLFIHTICGDTLTSGRGETLGNDFVVSLGASGWGNVINGHDTGSDEYKGATFMHELGHNLGLLHGGSEDLNCKPNYISVMNYLYQFPTYVPSRPLDYSRNLIPPLDETSLDERIGIGPSSPVGLPTAVGHTTFSHSGSISHTFPDFADNSNTNYNWYLGDNNFNQFPVQSSLINFHSTACNLDNLRTLFGFNDVQDNVLSFWGTSTGFLNATNGPGLRHVGTSDVGSPIVPIAMAGHLKNSNVSISNQFGIQNKSEVDKLEDPTVPPCDLSVLGCQDFPCDKKDPFCERRIDLGHDFTNTTLLSVDYGNRTAFEPELNLSDVLDSISSKVLDINGYIQSLNDSNFKSGTKVPELKQDLQHSLVNATDSVYSQIKSGKSDEPLAKSNKLRGLIHQTILDPAQRDALKLVDELIGALDKKPDRSND
jgi:hypothetical protein